MRHILTATALAAATMLTPAAAVAQRDVQDGAIFGAEMRFVPWSPEREAQDVADCHVGIMPLPDNEVSRGKGGMKALQFMATGRPVVVSPGKAIVEMRGLISIT